MIAKPDLIRIQVPASGNLARAFSKKRMEIHYNHVMHKQVSTPENFTHNSGAALYIFFRGLSNTPDSWPDTILEATQQRASPPENLRQQDKILVIQDLCQA